MLLTNRAAERQIYASTAGGRHLLRKSQRTACFSKLQARGLQILGSSALLVYMCDISIKCQSIMCSSTRKVRQPERPLACLHPCSWKQVAIRMTVCTTAFCGTLVAVAGPIEEQRFATIRSKARSFNQRRETRWRWGIGSNSVELLLRLADRLRRARASPCMVSRHCEPRQKRRFASSYCANTPVRRHHQAGLFLHINYLWSLIVVDAGGSQSLSPDRGRL